MVRISQDVLFTMASSVRIPVEPCSQCSSSPDGNPCDEAASCSMYVPFVKGRKAQMKRIGRASKRIGSSICQTCPVGGVCPVSFEERITLCPVKQRVARILLETAREHRFELDEES